MPANTSSYNFFLPTEGGDTDAWGGYLNSNWTALDGLLDGTTPVAGINITSGSVSGLTSLAVAGTGANAFITSVEDAGTTNILNVAQFLHTTTATPAIGIGTSIQLGAETEVGTTVGVQLDAVTTAIADATDGEAFDYVIKTKAAGVATPAERVRINSAGISISGDATFGDNDKAIFGAGSDLQIYHDGSSSYVSDVGTGSLLIQGENLILERPNGDNYLTATAGGALTLHHNAITKLTTTSTGIDVTGNVDVSSGIFVGAGSHYIYSIDADTLGFRVGPNPYDYLRFAEETDGGGSLSTGSGDLKLKIGSSTKLQLTSTGIDVTGTATMDGLTVGNSGVALTALGGGLDSGQIAANGDLYLKIDANNDYGTNNLYVTHDAGAPLMRIQENGDISFYEDTGTTAKFFWDASAESLGIGTTSPSAELDITAATTPELILHETTGPYNSTMTQSGRSLILGTNHSTGQILFRTDASAERMRIDSSGNVGIGTSSPTSPMHVQKSTGSGGVAIGLFRDESPASGGNGLLVDVTNTPQTYVADFRIGNSSKMRIDSSGNLLVGNTSGAAKLHVQGGASASTLADFNTKGTFAVSLANPANRIVFGYDASDQTIIQALNTSNAAKRLELNKYGGTVSTGSHLDVGGNVILSSGSGIDFSANGNATGMTSELLDDYEEGTFTPVYNALTSKTYTTQLGVYVKVGKLVHASIYIDCSAIDNTDTSGISISLPFVADAPTGSSGACVASVDAWKSTILSAGLSGTGIGGSVVGGNAYVLLTGNNDVLAYTELDASGIMQLAVTYYTTA